MIEVILSHPIFFSELSFIPLFLGSLILLNKKKKNESIVKDQPDKPTNADQESDYEKKYREYVNSINDEKNKSNQKYQRLYARIMGKVHLRKNIPSSQSLLRKLVTRTYTHFSRRRIRFTELKIDSRPLFKAIIYDRPFFFKYYYYYPLDPINKKRRYRQMNEGQISVRGFNTRKKRLPSRYLIPSNQGLEDLWWLKGQYGQVMIFRRLFMPAIRAMFKVDPRHFPKVPYQVTEGGWADRWSSYITKFLTPRTAFVDDRWWYNKPWMFHIFDTLTANRIYIYKQKRIKQRIRFLGKYKKKVALKRRRKKVRARTKFDRVTQFIYLNFYLFRRSNINILYRALQLNYSKYPIYKSSVRHMSHDLFSLLKQAKRTHKRKFTRNKRFRFLAPQKQKYFKDIERTRKKKKSKKSKKRNRSHNVGFVHYYEVRRLRKKMFRKTPAWLRSKINFLLKQWLNYNQPLDSIRSAYFRTNKLSHYRLDFTMASYAIQFPEKFKKMFQFELSKLKLQRNNYVNYLLKDPYGIQKVGSAFFYFVAPLNPIGQREQLLSQKSYLNSKTYQKLLEKFLTFSNWATSESTGSVFKKIAHLKNKKASKKKRRRKKIVRHRAIFDVYRQRRYNYTNFLNSFFKATILSYMRQLSDRKNSNTSLKKELPFDFLRSSLVISTNHLKTLYGYIFKTRQYRAFTYKKKFIRRKKSSKHLYKTPSIKKIPSYKKRNKVFYKKMFKRMFVRYPGKYNPYKRYFKLKAQNALPKGVDSLKDWFTLVKSWKNNAHESTSTRYLHLPFHLKGFFLRKKLNLITTKQGLHRYRLKHLLKIGRYIKRYTRTRFRVLNTKRHTVTRANRPAIRPNQTRHSLLNNQYLFMKELVQKYITQPTTQYYKYLTLLVQSYQQHKLTNFMLMAAGLKDPTNQKEGYLNITNKLSKYSSFFKHLLYKFIEEIPTQRLSQLLLNKTINIVYSLLINLFFIAISSCYFFSTFRITRLMTFYLIYFIKPMILLFTTITQKSNTFLGILFITFISPTIYAIILLLQIGTLVITESSLYILGVGYRLILPIWLIIKTILTHFFSGLRIIYSLYGKIYWTMILNIIRRVYTYTYNFSFTKYIIQAYRFGRNRRKASWIEYRTIAFYYMLISKFRPKGWKFLYQWSVFRHIDFNIDELMQVHLIFKRYFARIYRSFYRGTYIYERLLEISHGYLWRAFFGDWIFNGYINRFRSLYFNNYDSLVVAYMLYILFSPIIFINWLLTAQSFYKDVVLEFIAIPCYLIIYPGYVIYNQIYKVQFLNKILINTILFSYYYLVHLFKYLYHFIVLFHLVFPVYIEAARNSLFSFYPRRLIRGLDYAIGLEEEAFTSYSIILMLLGGLIYLFVVHMRIPNILGTGYRIMRLSSVNLSVPYLPYPFTSFDLNYDFKLSRIPFVDFIETLFARQLHYKIMKFNKRFYSLPSMWWLFRKYPLQGIINYAITWRHYQYGKYIRLFYIRKHCDTLIQDRTGIIKLKTGWKIHLPFPYVVDQEWWSNHDRIHKLDIWKYGRLAGSGGLMFLLRPNSRLRLYDLYKKYNFGGQYNNKFTLDAYDPIRVTYLGVPEKHEVQKLKKPRYIYDFKLRQIKKVEALPKKRLSGLRTTQRDYAYKSIKRGLSKNQHKYLGLKRYRPFKLSRYINVYHIRNGNWMINKSLNFIEKLVIFFIKIYEFNFYLILSGILIILNLLTPNFIKKKIIDFPLILIFKTWWDYKANIYNNDLTSDIILLKKSLLIILSSIYFRLRYLMPTTVTTVNSLIRDCYLILYELTEEWSYVFHKPSYETFIDYLFRIISFETIDKLVLKLYQVLIKKGYQLLRFRLGFENIDPFKDTRGKLFQPDRNLQVTEYQRYCFYKHNLEKQREFDKGLRRHDYCTPDEMKNQ